MTIALGFLCSDGIVLAADSQYTVGLAKIAGKKIFTIPSAPGYSVVIAGAGFVPNIEKAVDEITALLSSEVGTKGATTAKVKDVAERALHDLYAKHIDTAPPDARSELELDVLVAIWTPADGLALLKSARAGLTAVQLSGDPYVSIGTGQYIAKYLIEAVSRPGMHLEEAKPLSAYIISVAKTYVDFCGGATTIRTLGPDGKASRIRADEIKDAETYFQQLFANVGWLLQSLDINLPLGLANTETICKSITTSVEEFRRSQEARRLKAKKP